MDWTFWITLTVTALLFAPAALAVGPAEDSDRAGAAETPERAAFRLERLEAELAATEGPYLPFFESRSLRLGLYALPAGAEDLQPVHEEDEVYYVVKGRATLWVQGRGEAELIPVEPGATVFVRAGVEHRFIDIEEGLEVLVVFGATPTGGSDGEADR